MGDFKEWLSDNLRYFLVGVVVILIIGGSILGLKIYSSAVNGKDEPALIQKNTQAQTESKKETETKKETEKATKKQNEKETKKQTEKTTEKAAEKTTESQAASSDQTPDGNASDDSSSHGAGSEQNGDTYGGNDYDYNYDGSQQAEVISQETEAPQPQYMTINAACYMRSYPDYGDNIIGQFDAGTTVQFLADEGGWYKVSVNGQTGYIGARFFN